MKVSRRTLLLSTVAASVMLTVAPSLARNVVTYAPAVLAEVAAGGEPYLLDFSATWCSTCKAQERVLDELQTEHAGYDAIPIIRVDWDTYRTGQLVADLAIPRRSTLVLMQGSDELGRLVAQTGKDAIAALLDMAAA